MSSCQPTSAPSFEWDFDNPKKFIYSFQQTVEAENIMGQTPIHSSIIANGLLTVKVKENQLADVSLTKTKGAMVYYKEDGSPRDTLHQQFPTIVVQDMQSNGQFKSFSKDNPFDVLFPLPLENLQEGETYQLPMKIPFNANGSPLQVEGFNTLTFIGYQMIEGRNCAVLEGIVQIDQLEVPEELEGEYASSTTGRGLHYFDVENHYYVGTDLELTMYVHSKVSTSSGEEHFDFDMEMTSKNSYTVRLKKIEE